MAQGSQTPRRPRYWLITAPRTASNLLVQILNLDEQGVRPAHLGGYFFLLSGMTRFRLNRRSPDNWTDEERSELDGLIQQSCDAFLDHIEAAEKDGQTLYVKEHANLLNSPFYESQHVYGTQEGEQKPRLFMTEGIQNPSRSPLNLTVLPDEFLQTWNPTFLIRHPAMVLPSLYRTCQTDAEVEDFGRPNKWPMPAEVTMKWNRTLYDFYAAYFDESSIWPIVLDADDVMTSPELVSKYAQLAGLDHTKVRYSWGQCSEEKVNKMHPLEQKMLTSVITSTKVDQSKIAAGIDIDQEVIKWKSEFGEEGAQRLEQWVRDAMPHYNYMHSKRMRLE
ncbi:hypothetical protein FZEAL_10064 [Fusarium zealandicum]|uniref:P-loop containing nucleoside triphosphate hydrolase protein n=1 Tax=Fusarium zealandicum TaxID=1053134 RepID=A0A8H4U605_9HYPO|nr:hypothetical protein FZEAL_10064 [Fusarium zealandicum]